MQRRRPLVVRGHSYLGQAEVHRRRLRDVHDLAVRCHDEYEAVERLQNDYAC
jgi:hypothetical protein